MIFRLEQMLSAAMCKGACAFYSLFFLRCKNSNICAIDSNNTKVIKLFTFASALGTKRWRTISRASQFLVFHQYSCKRPRCIAQQSWHNKFNSAWLFIGASPTLAQVWSAGNVQSVLVLYL